MASCAGSAGQELPSARPMLAFPGTVRPLSSAPITRASTRWAATDNGGTSQYYRYDDRDRSLVCVSCPQDGRRPRRTPPRLPVVSPKPTDQGDFAFTTPTPLVARRPEHRRTGQDQPKSAPTSMSGATAACCWSPTASPTGQRQTAAPRRRSTRSAPSGRDIFFTAAAQYTPDALDGYNRLYDARIGGGFEFPTAPPPCPLEVCQGTPKGAPEEQAPGTGTFSGPAQRPAARDRHCAKRQAHRRPARTRTA